MPIRRSLDPGPSGAAPGSHRSWAAHVSTRTVRAASGGRSAVRHDGLGLAPRGIADASWRALASRGSQDLHLPPREISATGANRGTRMISYCIAVYRPTYTRLLLADLVRKTSVPYEILLWLNVADAQLDAYIDDMVGTGAQVRIVGRTPQNIGMKAYRMLFQRARYPLVTQIDDDVICISR